MVHFAGNTKTGFHCDGGPAVNAHLQGPIDIALDGVGNLYLMGGSRIRKIDTNGIITTIAGSGSPDYANDGGPATGSGTAYARSLRAA